MKKTQPPRERCAIHPGTELVDISVPVEQEPGKPYRSPRLEHACPECVVLVPLDRAVGLFGRPADWPDWPAPEEPKP